MSGYREHGFDPNAWEPQGRPLRPFDAWQWLGVALGSAAVLLLVADVAGRFGALPPLDPPAGAILFLALGGSLLVSYRRETLPGHRLPGSSPRQRLLVALALGAVGVAIAAIAILDSQGAL